MVLSCILVIVYELCFLPANEILFTATILLSGIFLYARRYSIMPYLYLCSISELGSAYDIGWFNHFIDFI